MTCYSPLHGFESQDGSFTFRRTDFPMTVPCGKCVGCLDVRSRDWATRCVHEAQFFQRSCFITLTYDDLRLPAGYSLVQGLVYEHFQLFLKRLRISFNGFQAVPGGKRPIRFFVAGEYGTSNARPHWHACLFNFDFDDKFLYKRTASGALIYRSSVLEDLWPFGFSSIGDVTFQSAAYIARYINAKVTGKDSEKFYQVFDLETGEIFDRRPEFNKSSLKPGLGAYWFDRYSSDVFPHDYVVLAGRKSKPPRYYDKLYARATAVSDHVGDRLFEYSALDDVKDRREDLALNSLDDNTTDRLRVREQVALAKLSFFKRQL